MIPRVRNCQGTASARCPGSGVPNSVGALSLSSRVRSRSADSCSIGRYTALLALSLFGCEASDKGLMAPPVENDASLAVAPAPASTDDAKPSDAPGQRWTSYGYDLNNSQYNPSETLLNADNVAGLHEQWRIEFPAGATSTPTVYDGVVYFGGWDGNVYAADARTGEVRWQRQVTSLLVRSTPLVTDDRVYVAAGPSLVALDRATGTTLFETTLDTSPDTLIDSSPKLVDGLVIIGVSSIETGYTKDDYVSIGAVVAIDARTGEQVWRVAATGDGPGPCIGGAGSSVWSTAAIDQELGLAYIGTGQGHESPASNCSDSLLAIHYPRSYQGERVAWIAQYTKDDVYSASLQDYFGTDGDVGAAPNLFEVGGQPLVGAGDKAGSYRAFDRRTGEQKWRLDLDHGDGTGLGGVMTTAAVSDGTVYVTSNHWGGILTVPVSQLTGAKDSSDTSTLYALDTATGKERWHVTLPAPMFGSFAIANGLLFHALIYGTLYARELATGRELWSVDLGGSVGVGPSIVNGRVYVSAGSGEVGATTATPGVAGGFVASFGVEPGPLTVWKAGMAQPKPLSEAECQTAVQNVAEWPSAEKPSDACSACFRPPARPSFAGSSRPKTCASAWGLPASQSFCRAMCLSALWRSLRASLAALMSADSNSLKRGRRGLVRANQLSATCSRAKPW
jgi:polyvinyl alcohol dehydrogenase (cytochrome)